MNLLAVIPVICYRKAIFLAALNVIIISFLTTKCKSLTTGRTVQDMRNPRTGTDKCGREGVVSNVCDPDRVISFSEGKLSNSTCFAVDKVKSMVDLDVRFDSNLTFRDHISEKINKAYSVVETPLIVLFHPTHRPTE